MSKALHMETTTVSVLRTCAEIEALLMERGATEVYKQFINRQVEGISFAMDLDGKRLDFRMPFRWQSIQQMATNGETGYKKTVEEEQARKVAARQILRWIEAQMALIQTGMAQMTEIFLPYIMVDHETTFHDKLIKDGYLMKFLPENTQ